MPKKMDPTDPKTILTGGGVKTTRTATRPAPKQVRKSAPRPSKRPR